MGEDGDLNNVFVNDSEVLTLVGGMKLMTLLENEVGPGSSQGLRSFLASNKVARLLLETFEKVHHLNTLCSLPHSHHHSTQGKDINRVEREDGYEALVRARDLLREEYGEEWGKELELMVSDRQKVSLITLITLVLLFTHPPSLLGGGKAQGPHGEADEARASEGRNSQRSKNPLSSFFSFSFSLPPTERDTQDKGDRDGSPR